MLKLFLYFLILFLSFKRSHTAPVITQVPDYFSPTDTYANYYSKECERTVSFIVSDSEPVVVTLNNGGLGIELLNNKTVGLVNHQFFRFNFTLPIDQISCQIKVVNQLNQEATLDFACQYSITPNVTEYGNRIHRVAANFNNFHIYFKINNFMVKSQDSPIVILERILTYYPSVGFNQVCYNTFYLVLFPTGNTTKSIDLDGKILIAVDPSNTKKNASLTVSEPNPYVDVSVRNWECSCQTPTSTKTFWCRFDDVKNDTANIIYSLNIANSMIFNPIYGNSNNGSYIIFYNSIVGTHPIDLRLNKFFQIFVVGAPTNVVTLSTPDLMPIELEPSSFETYAKTPYMDGGYFIQTRGLFNYYARGKQNFTNQIKFNDQKISFSPAYFLDDGIYGFANGTYDNYKRSTIIIGSKYESRKLADYYFFGSFQASSTLNPYEGDKEPPVITNFELIPIPGYNRIILLRVTITDNNSGFSRLYSSIGDNPSFILTSENLIKGTLLDGVYEVVIDNPSFYIDSFYVMDYASNTDIYGISTYGVTTINPFQRVPLSNPRNYNYHIIDFEITSAKWSHSNFDVSNATYTVDFMFSVTNPNKEYSPVFKFSQLDYSFLEFNTFYGQWNETLQLYVIPVTIPRRFLSGVIKYKIYYFKDILSSYLNAAFPSSTLIVHSDDADMFGPVIEDLVQVPSNMVTIGVGGETIGWTFKVTDRLNGFESGNLTVIGEYDQVERVYELDPNAQTQQIMININAICKSQAYVIKSIYLRDSSGFVSTNDIALMNYLDSSFSRINISCTASSDINPPVLTSYAFTPHSLDAGAPDRNVIFTITVEDHGSGINLDKLPVIYILSLQRIIKQACVFGAHDSVSATFTCTIRFPHGFAFPEFAAISIFGIMDNVGNFVGYTPKELLMISLSYEVRVSVPYFNYNLNSEIYSCSEITVNGGQLVILGKSFGTDNTSVVMIDYGDGNDYSQNSIPVFYSSTLLIINDVKPFTSFIRIRVNKNNLLSNEYNILPKPLPIYPPVPNESSESYESSVSSSVASSSSAQPSSSSEELPTQPPNPCSSNCGGPSQGVCSSTGCICNPPWIGKDCKSKTIVIPTPSINNTTPSTTIIVPSNTTDKNENLAFNGLIAIVELQELNQNGKLVYKYPFTQWIWSNISTDNEPIKYLYSTNITNQLDQSITNVSVSIQYFDKDENITFAGELLNMNQYSIKYSINITSYSFTNSLNQLQLIMKVSLESQQNQGCSALESGNTTVTNSEYVKLQVDDHSLYGRFIKRSIIDGRIASVTNNLLPNYNGESNQFNNINSYIGINVRSYRQLVQLDPDFSVLIDQRPAADNDNSVCSSKSKKLSTPQLIGIIIGSVAFAAIIGASLTYYLLKKREDSVFSNKLSKISRE
ncbi:hypothetical protein CYY_007958 [Polysphondylium violaceum]|uniref:EGF-like domain-containing protein n=1 Tax=Polysphondylium violaceum TaxID=133409 RepID=A0A8J4PNL8_9MYCE|nr:hypothetical protein CYY_007958 [Polysphondylium violaceum]